LFNRLKHYRRVATRYEKTAESFLAMVQVAAIMTWLL
ncbi:MAG: IS5/IS1182 family transposase, partial [Rhodothermales bacterium]